MKRTRNAAYHPLYSFYATDDAGRKTEIAQAIDQLNLRIIDLSPGKSLSDEYLDLIAKAQAVSEIGNWSEAYDSIWKATFLINRAIETINKRLDRIWLATTPVFSFFLLVFAYWFVHFFHIGGKSISTYFPFLWAGAIGGTTIAWWGLVKHTIAMDFDDQFNLWYYFKPLLGAIFGLISVLIIQGGLISLQPNVKIENKSILYLIAFIAGFSERFFVQLIDRVITAFFGGSEAEKPSAAPAPSQVQKGTSPAPPAPATPCEEGGVEPEHPGLP
ncbi:hypothetical protein L0128_12980 [candidate division KSB1 bacterium]|nr:hypothetical protein [candidate division KSB1 bacterium]